jgi:hypothetical protein
LVAGLACFAIAGESDFLAEAVGAAAKTAQRLVTMVSATTVIDVLLAKIVSRETAIPRSSGKGSPGMASRREDRSEAHVLLRKRQRSSFVPYHAQNFAILPPQATRSRSPAALKRA